MVDDQGLFSKSSRGATKLRPLSIRKLVVRGHR